MPWILDTLIGSDMYDILGRWKSGHDLTGKNVSTWNAPSEEMLPLHVKLGQAPKILPGLTSLAFTLIYANDAAKAVLERFAAGHVQYSPVVVHMPDDSIYSQPFYALTLRDSCLVDKGLVLEESDVRVKEGHRIPAGGGTYIDGKPHLRLTHNPPRLMWNRRAVGGRHIWADRELKGRILMSDDLYAALKEAGITGFRALESRFAAEGAAPPAAPPRETKAAQWLRGLFGKGH